MQRTTSPAWAVLMLAAACAAPAGPPRAGPPLVIGGQSYETEFRPQGAGGAGTVHVRLGGAWVSCGTAASAEDQAAVARCAREVRIFRFEERFEGR